MDRILEWLRNGEYPNCTRMMTEFGVDRKTAWRDIEWMKDRRELPIDYDEKRRGYFLSGPLPKVSGMAVTEREMFGLYVMHQAIEHYRGLPLANCFVSAKNHRRFRAVVLLMRNRVTPEA
jgi:proteasome accessory factor B